jgi:hypothetical protein
MYLYPLRLDFLEDQSALHALGNNKEMLDRRHRFRSGGFTELNVEPSDDGCKDESHLGPCKAKKAGTTTV